MANPKPQKTPLHSLKPRPDPNVALVKILKDNKLGIKILPQRIKYVDDGSVIIECPMVIAFWLKDEVKVQRQVEALKTIRKNQSKNFEKA